MDETLEELRIPGNRATTPVVVVLPFDVLLACPTLLPNAISFAQQAFAAERLANRRAPGDHSTVVYVSGAPAYVPDPNDVWATGKVPFWDNTSPDGELGDRRTACFSDGVWRWHDGWVSPDNAAPLTTRWYYRSSSEWTGAEVRFV